MAANPLQNQLDLYSSSEFTSLQCSHF
jgi:hypothetical protein